MLPDSGGRGWLLSVWVQPGAKSDQVVGILDGSLKLRICAPAMDNKALVGLVAKLLDLPRRQVSLVGGMTGRRKKLRIVAGEEPAWDRLIPGKAVDSPQ